MIGIVNVQVNVATLVLIPFLVGLAVTDDLRHRVRLPFGRNLRTASLVDDVDLVHYSNVFEDLFDYNRMFKKRLSPSKREATHGR